MLNNIFRSDFQFTMVIKPCLSRVWGFLVVSRCSLNSVGILWAFDFRYIILETICIFLLTGTADITNQGTDLNSWIRVYKTTQVIWIWVPKLLESWFMVINSQRNSFSPPPRTKAETDKPPHTDQLFFPTTPFTNNVTLWIVTSLGGLQFDPPSYTD